MYVMVLCYLYEVYGVGHAASRAPQLGAADSVRDKLQAIHNWRHLHIYTHTYVRAVIFDSAGVHTRSLACMRVPLTDDVSRT